MFYERNGIKTDPSRTKELASDDKVQGYLGNNGQFKPRHVIWLKWKLPQILRMLKKILRMGVLVHRPQKPLPSRMCARACL